MGGGGPGKNINHSGMSPMPMFTTFKAKEGGEIKFSDYIRMEKMRKFKRLPRLVGQRAPVRFTCPNCAKEGQTATNYELTGT